MSRRYIQAFEDQVEVLANMNVGQMWDRMLGEFLREWERVNRLGLPADQIERDMESFLRDLSTRPLEDLARQSSTVAFNEGRGASIKTAGDRGEVEYVVRSEVLDTETCDECAALDSLVVAVDSDEFDLYMPPAWCEGGDRCRGFYIPITGTDL